MLFRARFTCILLAVMILTFSLNSWSAGPETMKSSVNFAKFEKQWEEDYVLADGSVLNATNRAYVYLSQTENEGEWNLELVRSRYGFVFFPSFQFFNWSTNCTGVISDDNISLVVTPNGKEAYIEIDIEALPDIILDPFFLKSQTTPEGEAPIPFEPVALNFVWTNELWNKTDEHSNLEYEDRFMHEQIQSEYHGAYVDGFFLDLTIVPVAYGVPQGQMGETRTTRITSYK